MSLEQDSGSERLGELSLPDIFPVSLPSIISSPHATKKKNYSPNNDFFIRIYRYLHLPGYPHGKGIYSYAQS